MMMMSSGKLIPFCGFPTDGNTASSPPSPVNLTLSCNNIGIRRSFCSSSGKRRTQLFLTISRLSSDYHSSAQKDGSLAIQLGDYVSWHHCPCYHQQCHQSHDDQHYTSNNVEESSKREKYKMSLSSSKKANKNVPANVGSIKEGFDDTDGGYDNDKKALILSM